MTTTQTKQQKAEAVGPLRWIGGLSATVCVLSIGAATQFHVSQAVPVAVGSGVVTLTCAAIGVLVHRRKKNATRLGAILATEFGAEWDSTRDLKLGKFTNGAPRKVVVTYPARMPDHDPKWRAKIRELVRLRMGADAVRDNWDHTNGRVVFEGMDWTPAERELRDADTRLGAGLDTILGADWNPAEGMAVSEYRGAAPRKITIDYPARMPDHDKDWRERVTELVRQRMGADDVTATWVPASSRVVFVGIDWTATERERKDTERRIQKVLAPLFRGASHLDVSVSEWSAVEFPVRINLDYGVITQDASEIFQRRVEVTAGVKIGGRWRAVFDPRTDSGVLVPRPELPTNVIHPGLSLYEDSDPTAPILYYGVDENGDARGWTIGQKSNMPHMLCIGPTGGGKTTVLRSLIGGAVAQGIAVYGADPKRVELTPFRGFPGCHIASSPEQMALMIEQMDALMMERYDAVEAAINRREEPPQYKPVLFILDELLILRQVLKRYWAAQVDDKGRKRTGQPKWFDSIQALLALARTAMINVVIGVQRPDASLFDEGSRDNLQQRLSLMRLSPQASQMLWKSPYVGVDLPMIRGRAMASPDGETPIEMQTFWVADPINAHGADRELIEQIRARGEELFQDYVPPFDVTPFLGFHPEEQPAPVMPLTLAGVELGTREVDDSAVLDAHDSAGIDVDEVHADTLSAGDPEGEIPCDRIFYNGEPCDVLAVEDDPFTGVVAIDIRTSTGEQQIELGADEYVQRVLDLDAVAA